MQTPKFLQAYNKLKEPEGGYTDVFDKILYALSKVDLSR